MVDAEHRITILLNLLDTQTAESLLAGLPAERRERVQQRLVELEESPPSSAELEEVLGEFEEHMRRAFAIYDMQNNSSTSADAVSPADSAAAQRLGDNKVANSSNAAAEDEGPFVPSDNPLDDLNRVDVVRLGAALREESPVVISLIVNCLTSDRAGQVLQRLPADVRDVVFLRLKGKPNATRRMLEQIARATIEKACRFDEMELAAESVDYERKIVQILRSMERRQRNELLMSLEEKDGEIVGRLREMMYSVADLENLQDATVRKLLGDLDTPTLTKVLKGASDGVKERIFNNLSRRARDGLMEELEMTGMISEDERLAAERKVVEILVQLDQRGELAMIES